MTYHDILWHNVTYYDLMLKFICFLRRARWNWYSNTSENPNLRSCHDRPREMSEMLYRPLSRAFLKGLAGRGYSDNQIISYFFEYPTRMKTRSYLDIYNIYILYIYRYGNIFTYFLLFPNARNTMRKNTNWLTDYLIIWLSEYPLLLFVLQQN